MIDDIILTEFNFRVMRMNNNDMLIVFDLSEGAGNTKGEIDEVRVLLDRLHLIDKMKYKN